MKAKNAHSDCLYHYQGYECLTALAGIQYVDRVEEQKGANVQYMCQQLGNEVERQGKANKSTTPRTALSFQGKKELYSLGGIRTYDTLLSFFVKKMVCQECFENE